MNKEFRLVELQDLAISITDCHHSTPKYTESGKLVVRNYNIKKGRFLFENLSYTGQEQFEHRIARAKPEPGDLIITREAPMGEVCIIPDGLDCCLGQRMVLIKPDSKKVDNKFLLYSLLSNYCQTQINKSEGTGSIVSNLRIPVLKELHIPYLPLYNQQKITSILSAIDDKIELNNKINAELEGMAKLMYDYWFVQFDFPYDFRQGKPADETSNPKDVRPYKSSGGKMVWNKELKREVPEGWGVKELGKYANIKKGTLITEKTADTSGNIKVVSAGLGFSYHHSSPNFPKNTITISASGASAGFINFWREPIFACDCITVRGGSEAETLFILGFLKVRQEYLYSQARGSAQPHVYPKDIDGLHIAIPDKGLIKKFGELTVPGNNMISINLNENQQLSSLRDWLLPMLMNGQVRVEGDYELKDSEI